MEMSRAEIARSKSFEADVVVVGYGGAGAAAAIAAADLGAEVLIVEKGAGGGNTRLSAGSIRTFGAFDAAVEHIEFLCGGATDRGVIEALVRESDDLGGWLGSLGGKVLTDPLHTESTTYPIYPAGAVSPEQPGAAGVGPRIRVQGESTADGRALWALLAANVERRGVRLLCRTSGRRLLRDEGGAISGLLACENRRDIVIRARKAVIITCGGYEYDCDMQLQCLGQRYWSFGATGHTGDGIRMAAEVGASMWHMNAVAAGFGYRLPDYEGAVIHTMPAPGFIYVDNRARRFADETGMDAHAVGPLAAELDLHTMRRPRVPCFVIFGEEARRAGPVAITDRGDIAGRYRWSRDNAVEIAKGWIKAGHSPRGLAEGLGLDPDRLEQTIRTYNEMCVSGHDAEFGRSPATLRPLDVSRLYGVALWPSLFNTQGGPRRNASAQIIDVWGSPIKGLYGAGELGSMWSQNYPGASNLTEALTFGRIAGRNAANSG